jgi:3-methyladenine DNA glycosylase AlkC
MTTNAAPSAKFSLKDFLFNQEKVTKIANELAAVYPAFATERFINTVVGRFPELELKQRISWIRECLAEFLPAQYEAAVAVLLKALPSPCNPTKTDNDFGDFIYAPYADFVARYGCRKEYLKLSLAALEEITTRFSAEDAIRYFLNTFPDETLAQMTAWTQHEHYHVRRLASEGSRPKLPWSQKLTLPVEAGLPILDLLYADTTRYVTRSVANHLNDISKVQPELVLARLTKWQLAKKQNVAELTFITKHALRTLIKQGHPEALALLGINHETDVELTAFELAENTVRIGEAVRFSATLTAPAAETVLVDYVIYFQSKTGGATNSKVFKLGQFEMAPHQPLQISKKHPLRANMTTRTIIPGEHWVELQVNGKKLIKKRFEVVKS